MTALFPWELIVEGLTQTVAWAQIPASRMFQNCFLVPQYQSSRGEVGSPPSTRTHLGEASKQQE